MTSKAGEHQPIGTQLSLHISYSSRVIDEKEGQALAQSCNAAWVETSAKLNHNVGMCLLESSVRAIINN